MDLSALRLNSLLGLIFFRANELIVIHDYWLAHQVVFVVDGPPLAGCIDEGHIIDHFKAVAFVHVSCARWLVDRVVGPAQHGVICLGLTKHVQVGLDLLQHALLQRFAAPIATIGREVHHRVWRHVSNNTCYNEIRTATSHNGLLRDQYIQARRYQRPFFAQFFFAAAECHVSGHIQLMSFPAVILRLKCVPATLPRRAIDF